MTHPAPALRILLVEDDPDDYEITRDLLAEGIVPVPELTWAPTFEKAVEALAAGGFDCALVDYRLGAHSGVEILQHANVRASGTPVVMLTGMGREADLEATAQGAADFLSKQDLGAAALERSIRYAVESSRRHRVERRLQAFVEHSRDVIAVLDAAGRITWAAGDAMPTLGIPSERLIGGDVFEFVADPQEADALREVLREALEHPGVPQEGHARVRGAEGSLRDVEYTCTNLLDDPAIRGVALTTRDVTDRVERAERIRFQAELLDRVGSAVVAFDEGRRVIYWNRAAEEIFGWSWTEVRGQRLSEQLFPASQMALLEEIRATVDREGLWEGELALRRKSGEELIVLGSIVPTRDGDADGAGRVASVQDVTELRKAQRDLFAQRELLRSVVSAAPLVLWAIDAEGRYTLSEGHGLTSLGLAPGEAVGRSVFEMFADRPDLLSDVRRALGGEHFRTLREMAGRVFEAWWLPASDGSGAIGVSIDVTGQKQAEKEQERLLALLDSTPDFVGIATAEGNAVHVNPAGRAMLGLAPDAPLEGLTIPDFHPAWATRRIEEQALPTARREGAWSGESAIAGPAGKETPVWQVVVAHHDESGQVEFFSTVASDLTERNQAAEQINFQAHLLDTVGQAVIATDLEGSVTYWNRAAESLYGWTSEEAVGQSILMLTAGEQLRKEAVDIMEQLATGKPWTGEFVVTRKDQHAFPALVTNAPILDKDGKLTGIVGVSSDLTEIKRLEGDLRQAQKMEAVGRLAGGVAHDFNNLLTAIQVHAELLVRDTQPDAEAAAGLEEIQTATQRAADLTRQLLAFSRKQLLEERVLDLTAEVQSLERMLRRVVPENIDLCVAASGPMPVRADPTQMQQVLLNLVINSVDALGAGGRVDVRVERARLDAEDVADLTWTVAPGAYVQLVVEDNGEGMSPQIVDRVFEPFFTTKATGKGTGLGLSTVFGIVKQSGGHIFVTSEAGVGTKFRVLLPEVETVESRALESERRAVPPTPRDGSGRATVLVVEDDPSVRRATIRVLEAAGHTVLQATNGREAIQMAERNPGAIDVVVSDVIMPEVGGPELVRLMRQDQPDLKIILTSGYTREELPHGVGELGVTFLGKPFAADELVAAVDRLLEE